MFLIVVVGFALLICVAFGLVAIVLGVRSREPKVAWSSLVMLLPAAVCGWVIFRLVSLNDEIAGVNPARALSCTAEVLDVQGEVAQINDTHIYRYRVWVQIPGKAPYETDSTGASPLHGGGIGAGPTSYACLADRDDLKKVEILWDQPIR